MHQNYCRNDRIFGGSCDHEFHREDTTWNSSGGLGTDRRICMLLSGEPVYETDSGGKKRYLYGTTSQNKSVQ